MNGVIEALHIYDEHNHAILSHTYTSRPLSAQHLLPLYLEHPAPRPNLVYLANTNPPTLVFSLKHANLLFLATSSSEIEPLLVLEFIHRIVDVFEEFLGAPLLAHKIESNYDVVAQLLNEMCDAGTINTTEPNALRDLVEVEGWVGKLLGSITLPGKPGNFGTGFANPSTPSLIAQNTPALPWRRANVRHTSNEMYADIVETLTVTLAPSGRPLAAFANGTIAFTCKVSGMPDIVMTLTSPSGKHNLAGFMDLPVFHPCVRLSRWKERPGELSFVPPDGRFILASYEVDLLPFTNGKSGSLSVNNLKLPVNIEMKTGLGLTGSDFEVRLHVNKVLGAGGPSSASQYGRGGGGGGGAGRGFGGPHPGTPSSPLMEDLIVTVPLPAEVRNLSELRPSKGDATFNPSERVLEWHVPTKEISSGTSYFGLRCTVVGQLPDEDEDELDPNGFGFGKAYGYDEQPYQSSSPTQAKKTTDGGDDEKDAKKVAQNKMLMPSSASVSFSVKGWLPSGLKVESIMIDPRKSKGLGENVKPYKGVKYLTVSKGGVETRCVFTPVFSFSSSHSILGLGTFGQGVQKVGMITPWLEAFPRTAKPIIEEIDHYMGFKLSDVIADGPSKLLTKTPNAQPAIMATSILILRILEREFDFDVARRVDVTLGHSLGEFAALVAGGYLEFEDSLYLIRKRAEAMAEATRRAVEEYGGEYGMVAIVTEPEYLGPLIAAIHDFVGHSSAGSKGESSEDVPPIEQVLIANVNSKNQIVLSGNIERIKTLSTHVRQFLGHDPRAVRLNSDSPFHSPLMKPAVGVMQKILAKKSRVRGRETEDIITFPGRLPCISNVSARPFESREDVKDLLARQCLETVRWWDSIKYLDQEEKVRRWIGIGPGKVGRNLVGKEVGMRGKDSVKGGGVWAITDPSEIEEMLRGLEETEGLSDEEIE
ncbi:Adaptor complexes medium subunit family-domain-containing protein [Colletotrichum acutatum]|uniref:[acyl-carrier-protein] S-malonyltransferase n=1 Tax=Glomerella acutata TaxID=27357 RepID=A0AAD8UY09_GLOAC|nr:Adaptor complexes medium subunit family-domain-containing protein [Colletotrichum acutatum]KAK1728770.1 Adaptor complexes medium subunit family-domain-containing protein [Colletotrichum acutatum]